MSSSRVRERVEYLNSIHGKNSTHKSRDLETRASNFNMDEKEIKTLRDLLLNKDIDKRVSSLEDRKVGFVASNRLPHSIEWRFVSSNFTKAGINFTIEDYSDDFNFRIESVFDLSGSTDTRGEFKFFKEVEANNNKAIDKMKEFISTVIYLRKIVFPSLEQLTGHISTEPDKIIDNSNRNFSGRNL